MFHDLLLSIDMVTLKGGGSLLLGLEWQPVCIYLKICRILDELLL
jgi:hypothetical protein